MMQQQILKLVGVTRKLSDSTTYPRLDAHRATRAAVKEEQGRRRVSFDCRDGPFHVTASS
jgi:hypothetical protein